jgi:hypothetical protein
MGINVLPTLPLPAITANSIFTTTGLGNISIGTGGSGGVYSIGATGSSGQYLSGGAGWTTLNTYTSPSVTLNDSLQVKDKGLLEIRGDNADILINGVSLNETLANINARLGMMRPNPQIEAEWDELRELGDRYRALEADIKDKMQMWELLKKEY